MKHNKLEKRKLILLVLLLLTIGIGLGYAILTEQLKLNGSVNYGAMSWDVGFTSASDGGGSVETVSSISSDKKTITVSCNVGTSTDSETCIAKATIKNASTFAIELESDPTIEFNNTYISSVDVIWLDTSLNVLAGNVIGSNTEEEIQITISTKELTKEMLPENTLSLPVTIKFDFIESDGEKLSYDWNGASAVFIGDSITYGSGTTKAYHQYLKESLSLSSALNHGINSSTISANSDYGTTKQPLINRYTSIPDADLITIFMGTNDYGHETPLGTINDSTDVSFYGALNVIIPALKEAHPYSRIVLLTPIHRYGFGTSGILGTAFTYDHIPNGAGYSLGDYVNAIKNIGNKYSVPVIDLYTLFDLDVTDQSIRTQYIPDGLHPNAAGHEILANLIKNELKKIKPIKKDNSKLQEDFNNTTLQVGNDYGSTSLDSPNRASVNKNVYLEAGTVISLKDSSKYKYALYSQTSAQLVYTTNITGGYITTDYAIVNSGWYGIVLSKIDDTNFDFGGKDSNKLSDYINLVDLDDSIGNMTFQIGNKYGSSTENALNRVSLKENVYLNEGTVLSLKNNSVYKYSLYNQSSSTIEYSSNITNGWTTQEFVIQTSGWYGISIARNDDANFALGTVDPGLLDDYFSFDEDSSDEYKFVLGNKFDADYASASNRATVSKNLYLKAGYVISLKNSTNYQFAVSPQSSENIELNKDYLTGGWTTENYIVLTDGYYGITLKKSDNLDFDFISFDSDNFADYFEVDTNDSLLVYGNNFDSGYLDVKNRATLIRNVYLEAGTVVRLKDSSVYQYAIASQTGESIELNNVYLTGGWSSTEHVISTSGWYGFTVKRLDNGDLDLGGTDPSTIDEYLIFN